LGGKLEPVTILLQPVAF